jgi:uncharacterized protein YdeI (YjbR/CyaY-like superfamily)
MPSEPVYFRSGAELRRWFRKNSASATELVVGYMKTGTGTPSVTWPESVDEALCVGWIDGVRKRVDAKRYRIRFTPRRPGSRWSLVNIRRVRALKAAGRLKPAGLAAFKARKSYAVTPYYVLRKPVPLPRKYRDVLQRNAAAWAYYKACPPGYRKMCNWWIVSAKKPETSARRLGKLIDACTKGIRLY